MATETHSLPYWQTRTAQGFDVHAFEDAADRDTHVGENRNRQLVLCGVTFPDATPLRGHSDADVGMHAITDALFGTLADGDIGQHFPPSDTQWSGAASYIFLEKAAECLRNKGGYIEFVDLTLICESPKIGPRNQEMRQRIADILAIELALVSIKATTSERLGFTGRREGIAAMASATVLLPRDPANQQRASTP